ncbi:MAG: hypothetical protein MJ224_05105 [archaeon]|nr:hypothetical protein [archaeon]
MKFNFKLFKNKLYYKFSKNKYLPFLNSYSEQYIINLFIDQLEELSKEYDLGPVSFEIEYIDYAFEKIFYIEKSDKTLDELNTFYDKILDEMYLFSKSINLESFFKDVYILIKLN